MSAGLMGAGDRKTTFAQRLGWLLEAFGWDSVTGVLRALPLEAAADLGAAATARLGPFTSTHETAVRNIRLAFPNASSAEVGEIARECWHNIGRTFAEFAHMKELRPFENADRIKIEGADRLEAIRDTGKAHVFVSGHFSNWELMPATIARAGIKCQMTYRPANNPIIDKRILNIRADYGAAMQAGKGSQGAKLILQGLNKGFSVALMNDQKMNDGIAAPFFGHQAMTADGPARLAMRIGAPLQPMCLARTGNARFTIKTYEPIHPSQNPDKTLAVRETVLAITAFIEDRIRENPGQWFWVHRRWPKEAWRAAGLI